MAAVKKLDSLAILKNNMQMSKALGQAAAEVGMNILEQLTSQTEELIEGKELFDQLPIKNLTSLISTTDMIVEPGQLERSINSVASAKHWSPEITNNVKAFADMLHATDNEVKAGFSTESSSTCSVHIIAIARNEQGYQHIKVIYVGETISLTPKVIVEESEPVYVFKKVGILSRRTKVSYYRTKEQHVVPVEASAGDAEKIQNYITYKLCKKIVTMHPEYLKDCSPEIKSLCLKI